MSDQPNKKSDLKSSPAVQFIVGLGAIVLVVMVAVKSCGGGNSKPVAETSSVPTATTLDKDCACYKAKADEIKKSRYLTKDDDAQIKKECATECNFSSPQATEPAKSAPKTDVKEYAQKVKSLLQQDLKSVDVYIEDGGASKWMFVAIAYDEWLSMGVQDRKEMVTILLRGLREAFQDNTGLKVSVWVNERQRLAEGSWSFLSEKPEVELIGE